MWVESSIAVPALSSPRKVLSFRSRYRVWDLDCIDFTFYSCGSVFADDRLNHIATTVLVIEDSLASEVSICVLPTLHAGVSEIARLVEAQP